MIKENIFVGSDVTNDGVSIVVRSDAEIIHAEFYAVPPRKPLTDDQIYDLYNEPRSDAEMVAFARAIEKAHGIV